MKLAEFQKVTTILAREHKIKIMQGNCWAANIKERIVFYKKNDIYDLPEDHILGMILHEVAHIHYTTYVEAPKEHPELSMSALNMLEDISIEHIIGKDYPNAEEILASTKEEVLDTLVKVLPKLQDTSVFEKSLLYAAARFEGRGYKFGFKDYEKIGEKISKIMIKERKNILERKETKDLMPLVKKIVNLIIKEAGEPDEKDKQKMRQNNEEGQNGEKEGGNINNQTNGQEAKNKTAQGLKSGLGWRGNGSSMKCDIDFIDEIGDQAKIIGKQLRSVLKRNNSMEFGGRYRTGKLLARRLTRIKILKDRKPFARRIIKSNQSYAFAIAADISGSMFHRNRNNEINKISYALSSIYMVGEALRCASVPRSIIIFGKYPELISPIGKNQVRWDQLLDSNKHENAGPDETWIDRAIDACKKELDTTRAERKIMIILTDGASNLTDMKEAHKRAANAGIECLGITIGDERSSMFRYMDETFSEKKNTRIKETENTSLIGKAFIDILKKSITKSP